MLLNTARAIESASDRAIGCLIEHVIEGSWYQRDYTSQPRSHHVHVLHRLVRCRELRALANDVLVGVPPPARIFPADILFYCLPLALFAQTKSNKK